MLIDARIIILTVDDLEYAARWYATVLRFAPRRMEADKACFDGGTYELRLVHGTRANGPAGTLVYWRVSDLTLELRRWRTAGAILLTSPAEPDAIGSTATLLDPFNNLIGLVEERPTGRLI